MCQRPVTPIAVTLDEYHYGCGGKCIPIEAKESFEKQLAEKDAEINRLTERNAELENLKKPDCSWNDEHNADYNVWETDCGHCFEITDGAPSDNNMSYCCYCGGKIIEDSGND